MQKEPDEGVRPTLCFVGQDGILRAIGNRPLPHFRNSPYESHVIFVEEISLNAFVLRPLPSVADAHRVVAIEGRRRGNTMGVSYADFLDWRQQARAFSPIAATESFDPIVTGAGEPERVPGVRVTADFFDLFTARPALGRVFSPLDYAPGAPPVVVIGHKYWRRTFAGRWRF